MSESLSRALESLRSSIASSYEAWATWRDSAANAHCAAVMGSSVTRHLRFTEEYGASDLVNSDTALTQMLGRAEHYEPGLWQRAEDLLSWAFEAQFTLRLDSFRDKPADPEDS